MSPTPTPTVLPSPVVPTVQRIRDESATPTPEPLPSGRWQIAGEMTDARSSHVAVRLNDGAVMVAGGSQPIGLERAKGGRIIGITGWQSGEAIRSTEVFDPVTETWAMAGPLNAARLNATATLLPDGRVLIAGGENNGGTPLASAEIFDPIKFEWSPTASMATPRTLHTATLLPDGRVIVIGGNHVEDAPDPAAAEIFDPESMSWSEGPQLPVGVLQSSPVRLRHAAILLDEAHILVTGGLSPSTGQSEFTALQTAFILDFESMEWQETGAMGDRRQGHSLVKLDDGRILAVGGASQNPNSETYDPEKGEWFTVGANQRVWEDQTVTKLLDGRVLIAGGRSGFRQIDDAEIFDPATGQWRPIPDMDDNRMAATATLLEDGRVIVAGGVGADPDRRYNNTQTTEIYIPFD